MMKSIVRSANNSASGFSDPTIKSSQIINISEEMG
jgi:hypothetical protein